MTTASEVPKITGIDEAGSDQGRPAMSHFFRADDEEEAGMATVYFMSAPLSPTRHLPPIST
jgi:hypothetical protein